MEALILEHGVNALATLTIMCLVASFIVLIINGGN